jgi:hypothetical protein
VGRHPRGIPPFEPAQVAAVTPDQIAATENDPRVIRNKAKVRATAQNAREVLAVLDSYGSIRAYFASFPDAHAASADMRRRFKFLGDTGVWRLLTSASATSGDPGVQPAVGNVDAIAPVEAACVATPSARSRFGCGLDSCASYRQDLAAGPQRSDRPGVGGLAP